MQFTGFQQLDLSRLPTPRFVVDEVAIERTCASCGRWPMPAAPKYSLPEGIFRCGGWRRWCRAIWTAPAPADCTRRDWAVNNTAVRCVSSARPGSEASLAEILLLADHVVFNSCSQWVRFQPLIAAARQPATAQFGLAHKSGAFRGAVPIC